MTKCWGEKLQPSSHVLTGQEAGPRNGLQDEKRSRQEDVRKNGLVGKGKINATKECLKELMFTGNVWIIEPTGFEQRLAPTGKAGELLLKNRKKNPTE